MEEQLSRPYYQDTGRRPYLYYAVIGIDGEAELEISRSRHRVDEVPAGLVVSAFRRSEHAAEMDQLLGGVLGQVLERQDKALYEKAMAGKNWLILQGSVQKDDTLDYLRNAVGIVQAALDMGADAVLDLLALRLIPPQGWNGPFASPFSPWEHVAFLWSPMEDGSFWLHTRGMLKFGRPDIGLEGVPQSEQGRAMDIFRQMVFYGAQGAVFTENTKLHISRHTACMLHPELTGQMDDPDYNNEHYRMAWADCEFEDV
ncbi:MAG: hypothetical protein HFF52_05635 [Lawsonibacter sp.]|nr:hypothetical protein [Lawsonibacter sp.]